MFDSHLILQNLGDVRSVFCYVYVFLLTEKKILYAKGMSFIDINFNINMLEYN